VTQQVCNGAALACTFGAAPGTLTVMPATGVMASTQPAATVMDYAPMVNVATFGMCMSPSNPQVAAATAAALGVLTPQPCIPVTSSPWTPGSPTVTIGGNAALTSTDMCMCMWGGQITITSPGQQSVTDDG
jgi:hypothetical protein